MVLKKSATKSLITGYNIKETKSTENKHKADANFICEEDSLIVPTKSNALTSFFSDESDCEFVQKE